MHKGLELKARLSPPFHPKKQKNGLIDWTSAKYKDGC